MNIVKASSCFKTKKVAKPVHAVNGILGKKERLPSMDKGVAGATLELRCALTCLKATAPTEIHTETVISTATAISTDTTTSTDTAIQKARRKRSPPRAATAPARSSQRSGSETESVTTIPVELARVSQRTGSLTRATAALPCMEKSTECSENV